MPDRGAGDGKKDEDRDEAKSRGGGNLIAAAFVLALMVFGVWLFNAISASQKAQECLESRRRNCTMIEAPRQ